MQQDILSTYYFTDADTGSHFMNTGSLLKRFVSFHKNAISGTYEAS
jgi:hypothetical protein